MSKARGAAADRVEGPDDMFPEHVIRGAHVHAIPHLLVGSRVRLIAEVEPFWKALEPRRLPRRQPTQSVAEDACLRGGPAIQLCH